ncbi:hypothetical protein [Burkholderia lata]|uniref:hypothetical protein n=1 Tax=Burkholderia lata (strain ATCC 17760 / DSM 23089 / LMG 22485 / NCIMB 9086 / R18194 / 383) TaxID=482957 RepID=UPI0020C729CA|nr:hypothetical protein [Burkholderia lata]
MLLAAGAAVLATSACTTAPTLTFADQVKIACGAAQGEFAILTADGVFTGGAADTLTNKIQPAVSEVCAAGATVNTASLQAIVNTTLPLVKSVVDSSALAQDKKNAANAAIDTAVLAFNMAISLAPATPLSGAPLQ